MGQLAGVRSTKQVEDLLISPSQTRQSDERQRKQGNPAKSVAFSAGKKPQRQRKSRKSSKNVAFPGQKSGERQRKRETLKKKGS